MTKALRPAVAGLFLLVAANVAVAQTTAAGPRVRLQVVLNQFQGDTKTRSLPFFFSLALNEKGILRVDADPTKAAMDEACTSTLQPVQSVGTVQFVGTQVESMVASLPEGQFSVNLTFTERARAGCRNVGNLVIPVFSNRILAQSLSLKNGETREIALNESTRLVVTLNLQ
jgi:hypothetical protein